MLLVASEKMHDRQVLKENILPPQVVLKVTL